MALVGCFYSLNMFRAPSSAKIKIEDVTQHVKRTKHTNLKCYEIITVSQHFRYLTKIINSEKRKVVKEFLKVRYCAELMINSTILELIFSTDDSTQNALHSQIQKFLFFIWLDLTAFGQGKANPGDVIWWLFMTNCGC